MHNELTEEQAAIRAEAVSFAQKNKKAVARELTDKGRFPPEKEPVSVFMAGSPGAGKTEASKALIRELEGAPPVRIDPDDYRVHFAGYDGRNSWLFQAGVTIIVEKVHDFVLKNGQSFLLDGTLSHLDKARQNIQRSLKKGRHVQILYVYQEPQLAWKFVRAREKVEGRGILPEHFVEQYFAARQVVNQLKSEFGKDIHVDLILKDIDNSNKVYKDNISNIDDHVREKYTEDQVKELVSGDYGN
jgi:predicted ABC-type ATPase